MGAGIDQVVGRVAAGIVVAAVLGSSACATRQASNQMPPPVLGEAAIASRLAGPEQDFKVLEKTDTVAADVPEIYAWVRVRNISKIYSLRWLWYSPDGSLYYDSGESIVQPTGRYHPYVTSFHRLPIANWQAADLPGQWRVVIQLNQAELATLQFTLQPRPQQVVGEERKQS